MWKETQITDSNHSNITYEPPPFFIHCMTPERRCLIAEYLFHNTSTNLWCMAKPSVNPPGHVYLIKCCYTTTVLRPPGLCPGLPGWAGTRKVNQSGFTAARDSEWSWHQLGHMQICTSTQTGNHASTLPLSFLQAGCPSCCPTNRIKALKASALKVSSLKMLAVKASIK